MHLNINIPKTRHFVIGIILLLLAVLALKLNNIGVGFQNMLSPSIYYLLLPFAIANSGSVFRKTWRLSDFSICLLAFVFSLFITLGESICFVGDWSICFGSMLNVVIWFCRTILLTYSFYCLFFCFLGVIDKYKSSSCVFKINKKSVFFVSIIIKLLVWGFFFPCIFDFDSIVGLRTMIDPNEVANDMNPLFVQFIHVTAFAFGQWLGYNWIGFAILSLLFIILSSFVVVYCVSVFERFKVDNVLGYIAVGFYVFFPLYPILAVDTTKNGFFAYSFLFYLISLLDLYQSKGARLKDYKFCLINTIAMLLVCLTRKQGVYIIFVETIVLFLCYARYWKSIFANTVVPFVLLLMFKSLILQNFNIAPGSKQEIIGPLFQQTALYAKEYYAEITEEERSGINSVLNIDSIRYKYDPSITDPVKEGYKYVCVERSTQDKFLVHYRYVDHTDESKDLKTYFKAYFSMLAKHPLCYIEASWRVFGGFFYNMGYAILRGSSDWANNPVATTPEYSFWQYMGGSKLLNHLVYKLVFFPFIGLLLTLPLYTWLAIVLLTILVYKRHYKSVVFAMPIFLSIMVLLVCPVVSGNYCLPVVISVPLLFLFVLEQNKQ